MVEPFRVPSSLIKKIKATGYWDSDLDGYLSNKSHKARIFRTRKGKKLHLVIDKDGYILIHSNPTFNNGEPVGPDHFDFDPNDIVALVGGRKVKTGLWPWSYKMEDFDLVSIE